MSDELLETLAWCGTICFIWLCGFTFLGLLVWFKFGGFL